jgi:hypothetical protein
LLKGTIASHEIHQLISKKFELLSFFSEVLEGRGEASPSHCSEGYDSAQETGLKYKPFHTFAERKMAT